jgi:hypothetical protein
MTLLAAGGGYAIAAAHGRTIHACASKRSGALRLAAHCRRGERAVSWNAIGRRGPQGKKGVPGVQGQQGQQGVPGTPAAKSFVEADDTGAIVNQSGGIQIAHVATGAYRVVFPIDISHCATVGDLDQVPAAPGGETGSTFGTATAGHFGAGAPETLPGIGTVDSGRIATMSTTDSTGAFTDAGFSLAVFC